MSMVALNPVITCIIDFSAALTIPCALLTRSSVDGLYKSSCFRTYITGSSRQHSWISCSCSRDFATNILFDFAQLMRFRFRFTSEAETQ